MSNSSIRRVGITGGIGAGKSTVSDRLRHLGAVIVDADVAARAVVEPGTPGFLRLAARFGTQILHPDGTLHRSALARIVFENAAQRQTMNEILHPLILEWMVRQEAELCKKTGRNLVFWDVPLLIESNMHTLVDSVWVVSAKRSVRIKRIMQRDACTKTAALGRMRAQMPEREKRKYATWVLDNSTTREKLYEQVDMFYHRELQAACGEDLLEKKQ